MAIPSVDSVRKILEHILTDSTEVDMLFIDFFHEERRFTARGMSYNELINSMLTHVPLERILEVLQNSDTLSPKFRQYFHVLEFENDSMKASHKTGSVPSMEKEQPKHDIYKIYNYFRHIPFQKLQEIRAELPNAEADLFSPPEILAMEVALSIERGENTSDALLSIISNQDVEETTPLRLANPFQFAGPLGLDSTCYMPRLCDSQIRAAIQVHPLFAIWGPFQIGKTSLLLRMQQMLGPKWLSIVIDIMSFSAHNTAMFTKRFFARIEHHTHSRISDWSDLADFSHHQSLAILIDEIGALNPKIAQDILPRFRWLAERCRETIRIGCTMPQRALGYFESIDLINPKDRNYWKSIEVGPCGIIQLDIIMSCLPREVGLLARKFRSDILSYSNGMPMRIQVLCDKLFRISQEVVLTQPLVQSLVGQPSNYEPN